MEKDELQGPFQPKLFHNSRSCEAASRQSTCKEQRGRVGWVLLEAPREAAVMRRIQELG